ncbi:hypothetical protein RND81_08G180700 [Saponaria officinalis]|uniref:Retrotransposon Copia-like N-terminal domain-containing protein n=1 Tax=Saponaria officinalis TaxID=3572 RepID=A0AAW1J9I9_SAPOF
MPNHDQQAPPPKPNPLYVLASSDGPGTVITHVVLKGPNYEEWAKGFRVSLGAKRKLGFIDGVLKQPESGSADLEDWLTVHEFLMGLEPYYATVRSTILGIEPLPSVHTVYSRIVQEEEVRLLTQRRTENPAPAMAFVVKAGSSSVSKVGGSHRPIWKCTHCCKTGHTEERCWEKHGYPEGRGPKRTENGSGDMSGSATLRDAPSSSHQPKANMVTGEVPATINHVRLKGKNVFQWIIDTGASTHICCDENLFDTCRVITPMRVRLPNGDDLEASKVGRVTINDKIVLTNDPTMTTRIGEGELINGLYCLTMREPMRVNVVSKTESVELWHKRLGHPSPHALQLLP